MIRFHGYFRSSAAYRCRIAFNLKGIETEFIPVHLRKGEHKESAYRDLNPQALLPAVEADGHVFYQSLAIIEWLEETHPEPALLPADPAGKAHVRAFSQIIACDIHPLQNLRVLDYLRSEYDQDQGGIEAWCRRWIGEGLAACEEIVARAKTPGDFCFGETPGLADICLVPQIFNANRFGVDMSKMPHLSAIHAACEALPAFADAHPARQPDSEA